MAKRQEIQRVLIIGSGPIMIGQACEFDYSGTQACKALMKEGLEVILVNSNPATIMTDPELATKVYIEPLTVDFLDKILAKEKPDSIIPTLGGQTALNLALELHEKGILQKHGVRLLGADPVVIKAAEDREIFRAILDKVGAHYPKSFLVRNFEQGLEAEASLGLPMILRPNYTLGGGGGGIAFSSEEYRKMLVNALHESPTSEVLVEESILGWKEFELEVMRDNKGTFVVICTIENLNPCGVHTGDSVTVAPIQTLSDVEYQAMRDEACKILNEVGVETGGANIQFATHPTTGARVVIEMNPRVSRSSALASKATGFPIAKIAALLAIGYTLDEIRNDITLKTPSAFEPALDYVVTKIPRFAFEKFGGAKDYLTTQMKSVGEVMAIGRTFQESIMKALAALEGSTEAIPDRPLIPEQLSSPNSQQIYQIFAALRQGWSVEQIQEATQYTPWFLEQLQEIVAFEKTLASDYKKNPRQTLLDAKRIGFTDARIAKLIGSTEIQMRTARSEHKVHPGFLPIDTCAGEFESNTPYYYSTYWSKMTPGFSFKKPVAVIGSGPNRIGQGIEFDYSCVRGVKALQRLGSQVIMINSNPETVSTDYDTSDALFFEPLTVEHVNEVLRVTQSQGFVAQLGGQTPINLAHALVQQGHALIGSSLESIDLAEDRNRFAEVCHKLHLKVPSSAMVKNLTEALAFVQRVTYPIIIRPSYVLGGRRMEVLENDEELTSYFHRYADFITPEKPCFVDQFLAGALEVDVDLVGSGKWYKIGGVIEHIEAAGVHSGDSMGVIPPQRLKTATLERVEELALVLARELKVKGMLNLQLAIKEDQIYILEANPRSSRSVPFIAKAAGIPLVDWGVLGMLDAPEPTAEHNWKDMKTICVKGVVFPFKKFPEADSILGPEMKSTGESMGRGQDYAEALAKAFISSHYRFPLNGEVFFSLREKDKMQMLELAKKISSMGYKLSATRGTAQFFQDQGLECSGYKKVHEGRPHCVDHIRSGKVNFVINTTTGRRSIEASFDIRRACIDYSIPCLTESDAAEAFIQALERTRNHSALPMTVSPL